MEGRREGRVQEGRVGGRGIEEEEGRERRGGGSWPATVTVVLVNVIYSLSITHSDASIHSVTHPQISV